MQWEWSSDLKTARKSQQHPTAVISVPRTPIDQFRAGIPAWDVSFSLTTEFLRPVSPCTKSWNILLRHLHWHQQKQHNTAQPNTTQNSRNKYRNTSTHNFTHTLPSPHFEQDDQYTRTTTHNRVYGLGWEACWSNLEWTNEEQCTNQAILSFIENPRASVCEQLYRRGSDQHMAQHMRYCPKEERRKTSSGAPQIQCLPGSTYKQGRGKKPHEKGWPTLSHIQSEEYTMSYPIRYILQH